MNNTARILIFTGDGKGKTTAALGMAFRAAGHGLRSCVIQFVKADDTVGEVAAAAGAGLIEIHQTGRGFLPPAGDPRWETHRAAAQNGLRMAAEAVDSGRYRLVVLDEICFAVARGLIDEGQVRDLVAQAHSRQVLPSPPAPLPQAGEGSSKLVAQSSPETCLVLTGRGATPGLVALADTVTEMRCVKHGFQAGWPAQEGVER